MATAVVMPKLGNSVESSILVDWKKEVGDVIAEGDVLCEVETDKAVMEVPSTAAGTLLARFFVADDEVPVMVNIAAIGEPGEDVSALNPNAAEEAPVAAAPAAVTTSPPLSVATPPAPESQIPNPQFAISPRARGLASRKNLPTTDLSGTGPGGRVIERDIEAALAAQPKISPVAQAMVAEGEYQAPASGSGLGGRIMTRDLVGSGKLQGFDVSSAERASGEVEDVSRFTDHEDEVEIIPVRGVRKVIAERMLASLQTTAQLTLNASADARAILAYRKRLKASPDALDLQDVTINDLVLFAVSRSLLQYPGLNALFDGETISQYSHVHLGVAVDTPRGLMVPTVRYADTLNLRQLAAEAKRLATACIEGGVMPDELSGGTFTVTNLGAFGVESFTPVLNAPQVGILGVSNINLKPIQVDDEAKLIPHIGLSLTINHQVVDGAPAARFLQTLAQGIAEIDLLLAI